ncbi:MAG: hypothetical protein M1834_006181 [Cirrosporium novae-zelandiae]|nr:MAG: hypothetical protein M1834_006181 [Cirrosporium novae-zelandiae]
MKAMLLPSALPRCSGNNQINNINNMQAPTTPKTPYLSSMPSRPSKDDSDALSRVYSACRLLQQQCMFAAPPSPSPSHNARVTYTPSTGAAKRTLLPAAPIPLPKPFTPTVIIAPRRTSVAMPAPVRLASKRLQDATTTSKPKISVPKGIKRCRDDVDDLTKDTIATKKGIHENQQHKASPRKQVKLTEPPRTPKQRRSIRNSENLPLGLTKDELSYAMSAPVCSPLQTRKHVTPSTPAKAERHEQPQPENANLQLYPEDDDDEDPTPSPSPEYIQQLSWTPSTDKRLIALLLSKIQLSDQQWEECARQVGCSRDTIKGRWKRLVDGEGMSIKGRRLVR